MRPVYKVSPLRDSTPTPMMRRSASWAGAQGEEGAAESPLTPDGLVFDLDGLTLEGPGSLPKQLSAVDAEPTVEQLRWLLQPTSDSEKLLKLHVSVAREMAPGGQVDAALLGKALKSAGYTVKLHSPAANKLRGLRHQYLSVCLPDGGASGPASYIVDPAFRDSFVVARPTPRYEAVLGSLPPEVVATQSSLRRAVTILSRELARSFTEQGSPVPPWRTHQALLSKWELQRSAAGCGGALLGESGPEAGQPSLGSSPAFGRVS